VVEASPVQIWARDGNGKRSMRTRPMLRASKRATARLVGSNAASSCSIARRAAGLLLEAAEAQSSGDGFRPPAGVAAQLRVAERVVPTATASAGSAIDLNEGRSGRSGDTRTDPRTHDASSTRRTLDHA